MKQDSKPSRFSIPLALLAALVVFVCFFLVMYRPDRALPSIVPGSSSGPAFTVQIIRPRSALPLGGLLPPSLFGLDGRLEFDSTSAGATSGSVGTRRLELRADGWELMLVLDAQGRVSPETQVVFQLEFQEQTRKLRCWPGDPAIGTFSSTTLDGSGELSGSFDVELARCEDAETGKPLGWPQSPFVLHGSFDRLLAKDNDD